MNHQVEFHAQRSAGEVSGRPVEVLVRYRVRYGRTGKAMGERLFSTHETAKAFAQRKMSDPGWRVSGWPTRVEFPLPANIVLTAAAIGHTP